MSCPPCCIPQELLDEGCIVCRKGDERIKELEKENQSLKTIIQILQNGLNKKTRQINKSWRDGYDDVEYPGRDK